MNKCKLKDVTEIITKGTTPSTIGFNFIRTGINFVKAESLTFSKYLDNKMFEHINDITDNKLRRSRLKKGDLLFSIAGYLGKICIVRDIDLPANTNQAVGIVRIDPRKANVDYLYYYFSQTILQKYINQLSSQSVQANLNLELLGNLEFDEKDIEDQKKISSILSSLDCKIDLNNRINSELEAMMKTFYDFWFVQFDFPNKEGKPFKTSGGKMVWNKELKREIPVGWDIESIEKCCSIIDCLHSKKSDCKFEDERYYLLQLENIRDDGLLDLTNKYYVTKDEYKKWTSRVEVIEDDIIITNAGRVAATAQIPSGIVTGIGRNITAIRPKSINSTYLFLAFRGVDMKRQIKWNTDSGAFFTSLNVKGIRKLSILRPPDRIEDKFEGIVKPIRQKREINNLENQKLTELRDWLLPMLMNGQVKVD